MCDCHNIEIGSYDNQTKLHRPDHMIGRHEGSSNDIICVDTCLVEEILLLWLLGIHTTGCCCGHNKLEGYIGVIDEDINSMLNLGYKIHINKTYPDRKDSFIPMSI